MATAYTKLTYDEIMLILGELRRASDTPTSFSEYRVSMRLIKKMENMKERIERDHPGIKVGFD